MTYVKNTAIHKLKKETAKNTVFKKIKVMLEEKMVIVRGTLI